MKIKVLETETTQKDEIVRKLIGTTWTTDKFFDDYIIIDCCGGLRLLEGEYEVI